MGKLQAHEESQWDSRGCGCTNIFFQSKMVLDIFNEEEEEKDLEKKVEEALTDQTVNQMKGIDQLI